MYTTFFVLSIAIGSVICNANYAYITWKNGRPQITFSTDHQVQLPSEYVARATYFNKINETGWAFLNLHTSEQAEDEQQAFSAGYLEGFLTRELVWMHWQNMLKGYCAGKLDICNLIEDFIDKNENYIQHMVKKNIDDSYWYHIKLYYIQLEGLSIGYNEATEDPAHRLSVRDIVWLNMLGDLDDLSVALSTPDELPDGLLFGSDRCSGLVKLLPDFSNLYTSQVTWNSYQSMLRIQKMYVMNLRMAPNVNERIPGYKMSLSSYPGLIHSLDDFYIISSGLVPAETTIGNSNRSLFENVKPVGTIFEYARAMMANRLATTGHDWVRIFRKHNSGTYNNQWYIVDYKQFRPSTNTTHAVIKPGLLWVIEQLPGYTDAADLTNHLKDTKYFPSYNIPFFAKIFNMSGGNARVDIYGDWFTYDNNPRAKIFKQKQEGIYNIHDMYEVMRYNDYKHDPLAHCDVCIPPYSAINAIAARNDLNPANGTYPFRALGHRCHGGTDAKVTSYYLHRKYEFIAVSSPTHNISRGIPPFRWSEFDLGKTVSHVGHPDTWLFKPLRYKWDWGGSSNPKKSTPNI